jgi:hypothetical protein
VLVAGVAFAAPAVATDKAEARTSVTAQIKAKTRSNAMNTVGYVYAFRVTDCWHFRGLWSCEWTGRKNGWRVDGTTMGSRSRSGRLYDVISYTG